MNTINETRNRKHITRRQRESGVGRRKIRGRKQKSKEKGEAG